MLKFIFTYWPFLAALSCSRSLVVGPPIDSLTFEKEYQIVT